MESTGPIESWRVDPSQVGPIYPFVGWEIFMFAICTALFLVFLVWKFADEKKKYAAQITSIRTTGLKSGVPHDEVA